MIVYLIKVTACSAAFILIYWLLLEKDKMSHFKRFYLVGSLLLSFVIPLVSWQSTNEVLNEIQPLRFWEEPKPAAEQINTLSAEHPVEVNTSQDYQVQDAVIGLYVLISFGLLIRLLVSVSLLLRKVRREDMTEYNGTKLVLVDYCIPTHSFLHYIFLSKSDYEEGNIPEEVLHHELIHIQQKHTLDVLFIETLMILMWFNPLLLFYKRAIHLNHEFLADEGVVSRFRNVPAYQKLLVNLTEKDHRLTLTSPFNYLITKKRLIMMTKKTNLTTKGLKLIALVPMILLVMFFASERSIAQKVNSEFIEEAKKDIKTLQEAPGINAEEEARLNSLLTEYRPMSIKIFDIMQEGTEETQEAKAMRKEIVSLFLKMTEEQQSDYPIMLIKLMGIGKKKVPTVEQMDQWTNGYPGVYRVFIDGEPVLKNKTLANYSNTDFSRVSVSRPIERQKNLYGKYDYLVYLSTNEQFEERQRKADLVKGEYFISWRNQ